MRGSPWRILRLWPCAFHVHCGKRTSWPVREKSNEKDCKSLKPLCCRNLCIRWSIPVPLLVTNPSSGFLRSLSSRLGHSIGKSRITYPKVPRISLDCSFDSSLSFTVLRCFCKDRISPVEVCESGRAREVRAHQETSAAHKPKGI